MADKTQQLVLVTGLNGYMGSNVVLAALQTGYRVRGTVRARSKAERFLNGAFKQFGSRLEVVEVPDITVKGAFDEAVKDVHYILHTASPLNTKYTTIHDTIRPAAQGTLRLLEAARDHAGSQLISLVFCASVSSITGYVPKQGHRYREADFAEDALEMALASQEEHQSPNLLYYASKISAEKAFWEFHEMEKPRFAMTALPICTTFGPPIQPPTSPSDLNMTLSLVWKLFSGEAKELPAAVGTGSFVDVRDVAAVHIWAMENPHIANGQRYIAANSKGPVQAFVDVMREAFPERKGVIVEGSPYVGYARSFDWGEGEWRLDTSKLRGMFEHEWIPFDRSIRETCESLQSLL